MNNFLTLFEKQPKAIKIGVLAGLILLMVLVEYKFFISPRKVSITQNTTKIAALQKDYDESKAIADNLQNFIAEVNLLDEEFKRALQLLPNDEDIQGVLRLISRESKKTNIRLISFKPEGNGAGSFYSTIKMTLQFEGSFHDIAKFIDRVGKLKRIINISNIAFDKPGAKGANLKVTVKAMTYMFGAKT